MAVYQNENFAAEQPLDVGGVKRGVPLHEDKDPNEYIDCNLQNREPPADSTVTRCNTALRIASANETVGTVRVNGRMVACTWFDDIVYGRWTPDGYVYLPQPRIVSRFRLMGE